MTALKPKIFNTEGAGDHRVTRACALSVALAALTVFALVRKSYYKLDSVYDSSRFQFPVAET